MNLAIYFSKIKNPKVSYISLSDISVIAGAGSVLVFIISVIIYSYQTKHRKKDPKRFKHTQKICFVIEKDKIEQTISSIKKLSYLKNIQTIEDINYTLITAHVPTRTFFENKELKNYGFQDGDYFRGKNIQLKFFQLKNESIFEIETKSLSFFELFDFTQSGYSLVLKIKDDLGYNDKKAI